MARKKINPQFGRNLKRIREAVGMSQEDLAKKSKVHRNYIGLFERGEKNPTLGRLVDIARVLGTSVSKLLEGVV